MITPFASPDNEYSAGTDVASRIAVLGGTFDPVHFGHLRTAIELANSVAADVVHLMPNHLPVHRPPSHASTTDRLAMLARAVDGVMGLCVDPREAERDGPSYTVDTLAELRDENPTATLVFCMGLDAFSGFTRWHQPERILELANLLVVDRPGADLSSESEALLVRQCEQFGTHIRPGSAGVIARHRVTALEISATRLRADLAAGRSIRFLVPEAVRAYIHAHGLYQGGPDADA